MHISSTLLVEKAGIFYAKFLTTATDYFKLFVRIIFSSTVTILKFLPQQPHYEFLKVIKKLQRNTFR